MTGKTRNAPKRARASGDHAEEEARPDEGTLAISRAEHRDSETAIVSGAASARETAEVQAAMVVAQRFPRNMIRATDRIIESCRRPTLAEAALYSYARGGTEITGPSIRLAEAMAQSWGNLTFGVREIEQRAAAGESIVEAFAWDLETNVRSVKVFTVRHERHTRQGSYRLTDPRDVYEMVANQGARRLRACLLAVIPGDVTDSAVRECESTLRSTADVTPERLKAMISRFAEMGVTREQIEARVQRKVDTISPAQMVGLGKIHNSIRDGMSKAADWFPSPASEKNGTGVEGLKARLGAVKNGTTPPAPIPADPVPVAPAADDLVLEPVDSAPPVPAKPSETEEVYDYARVAREAEAIGLNAVELGRVLVKRYNVTKRSNVDPVLAVGLCLAFGAVKSEEARLVRLAGATFDILDEADASILPTA